MERSCDGSLMWRVCAGETDLPLWRAAEEWGGLALLNVCVCLIVFSLPHPHHLSPLSLSAVLPFSLSCLDSCLSFPCQHSRRLLIPASMHVLLCIWSCSMHLCAFWKIKTDKKNQEETLEGKKNPPQHDREGDLEDLKSNSFSSVDADVTFWLLHF